MLQFVGPSSLPAANSGIRHNVAYHPRPNQANHQEHFRSAQSTLAATTAVAVAAAALKGSSRRQQSGKKASRTAAWSSVARRATTELVSGFTSACSTYKDWRQAIQEVAEATGKGYECGFAFICQQHVDLAQGLAPVLEQLREELGVQTLVGCAAGGALGQAAGPTAKEYAGGGEGTDWPPIEVEGGFFLSVGLIRKAGATPFFMGRKQDGTWGGDSDLLERKSADNDTRSILMIADPFGNADDLMSRLDTLFPKAVKAGGISLPLQVGQAERNAFMPSIAIASEGLSQARLCSQGVVGLLMSEMDIHTVVCQGCCGVGPAVRVSSVEGPVCDGIGGRPANEALRYIFSAVDPPTREKMQKFLTIGLGRVGEPEGNLGDGDWLIRMISGVTQTGGLIIGNDIQEGQPLRFHVRDRESAENDLELMLKRYRLEKNFQSSMGDAIGSFLFTCNGRGEGLYGRRHVDARAVASVLPEDCSTRVAGFFCNGELGSPGIAVPPEGDSLRGTAVHGFTAVFALLVPVQG